MKVSVPRSGPTRPRTELKDARFAIIVSQFNCDVTERLLNGALSCLAKHGAPVASTSVLRVPGAWELPQATQRVVTRGLNDAVIALGCVIRGETPHFDYVCREASAGLGIVARSSDIPVTFGVLTTDTLRQAMVRAGDDPTNKGYEAAEAAIDMLMLFREIDADGSAG